MFDEVVDALEHAILEGRARWIADLNETFRDYLLEGHKFDIFARGQTRGKGFMLSQFFAWTVLPNYKVSLYAKAVTNPVQFMKGNLIQLVGLIKKNMEKDNVKWAWLILFFEGDPPDRIREMIKEFNDNDVGIGSVNVYSGNALVSNNLLGRSLVKHMRIQELVPNFERRKGK